MKNNKTRLQKLNEDLKNKKYEAYIEVHRKFKSYSSSIYERYIGKNYGNKYKFEYISRGEDEIISGAHDFNGVDEKQFYSYINTRIKNCCLKFLRDYIKPSYQVVSLNEYYKGTSITKYSADMLQVEEYVTVKITNEELIYKELMPMLSKEEREALKCRLDENETIEEYAKRKNCKEVTVRSYMSKAVKKLRNSSNIDELAKKYMINF